MTELNSPVTTANVKAVSADIEDQKARHRSLAAALRELRLLRAIIDDAADGANVQSVAISCREELRI